MSVQLGQAAPNFSSLKSTDGKSYSLSEFNEKALVIIFSCNHCPYVKAYEDRYISIQNEYIDKGVRFIVINSNDAIKYPEDSFEKMVERAKDKSYNFPYLYDEDQSVAKNFGATNTPHVFVLDESREVKYIGRIDDSWEDSSQVTKHDLKSALDSILEGKTPENETTLPVGCSIKWKN